MRSPKMQVAQGWWRRPFVGKMKTLETATPNWPCSRSFVVLASLLIFQNFYNLTCKNRLMLGLSYLNFLYNVTEISALYCFMAHQQVSRQGSLGKLFIIMKWLMWLWTLASHTIHRLSRRPGDPGEAWWSSSPRLKASGVVPAWRPVGLRPNVPVWV